jgi:pyrimidine operon attenuation protein/uracil phosphoribosyltransferase
MTTTAPQGVTELKTIMRDDNKMVGVTKLGRTIRSALSELREIHTDLPFAILTVILSDELNK